MSHTALVIVDVQERLFAAMEGAQRDAMLGNIKLLAAAARRLGVPVVVTEQYPKGLGHTLPQVRESVGDVAPLEKTAFSCCGAEGFLDRLQAARADSVILTGIEAHVCVLLTALDLVGRGFHVSVVADAVCSRRSSNLEQGLAQMRQAGAVVTSTETLVFQLLGSADHEAFRDLSKLLR
jgi:nicotinamidase-related amidase